MNDSDKLKRIKEIITSVRNLETRTIEALNQIEDVIDGTERITG